VFLSYKYRQNRDNGMVFVVRIIKHRRRFIKSGFEQ
jgi:hypothetical protein